MARKPTLPIEDVLEACPFQIEGIPCWKGKGEELTAENVSSCLFVLSSDLAQYLGIRHNNLRRNISKLLKDRYLQDHLLTVEQMIEKGKSAQASQSVHALKIQDVNFLLLDILSASIREKKFSLFKILQNPGEIILQMEESQEFKEFLEETTSDIPLLQDILEPYGQTSEGIQLWKTKGASITFENVLENIFVLSNELAAYFEVRHSDLCSKNVSKLQQEGFISIHARKISHILKMKNHAQRKQVVYALTRHQTEFLIMDFSGPRARAKKLRILQRLHSIESDVLKGAYEEARRKASDWDGISLLKERGLRFSVPGDIATKKDICSFLRVKSSTLDTFLRRNKGRIAPMPLSPQTIQDLRSKARKMHGYKAEDVVKIAFWLDSEIGVELKKSILEKSGVEWLSRPKEEMEWRVVLAKVFTGLGLCYNHNIGKYKVDFFVSRLDLVLECDFDDHRSYDAQQEAERDRFISQSCTLIHFNPNVSLESLCNAILKAKPREVVRLYGECAKS